MSEKHLLWWIFTYMTARYPKILAEMIEFLPGDTNNGWVNHAIQDRYAAWKQSVSRSEV